MSIAKKSMKWLVAAIIAFALVLTAIFAVGNVATASADDDDVVSTGVIVLASSNVNQDDPYPNLTTGTAYTITADYYLDIPASGELSVMKLQPVLNPASAAAMKPSSITPNPSLPIELDYAAEYCAGTATVMYVSLTSGNATALDGYDVSNDGDNDTYTLGTWLFRATYTLSDEAAAGLYTFSFASDTEFALTSGDVEYIPTVKTTWANGDDVALSNASVFERAKGTFNLRTTIPVPTITEETRTYNGDEQTYSGGDTGYTFTASGENVGDYDITISLTDKVTTQWAGAAIGAETADITQEDGFHITTKYIHAPTATLSVEYDGEEHVFAVTEYAQGDSDWYSFTAIEDAVNVGTYPLTVSLSDVANTAWGDADNHSIEDLVYNFEITPVMVTKPTASTTTYYYNPSVEYQTYGFATAGDSDKYTVTNNTRKNAGTQTVTVALNNANYVWADGTTANLEFTFTIKKLNVMAAVCALLEDNTFTYTGEPITCNFIYEGQTDYFTMTGHTQTDVGLYDVTLTLNDPNNYKWSNFPNVSDDEPTAPYVQESTFRITKRAVTIPTAVSGLTYTGSEQSGVNKVDGSYYDLVAGGTEAATAVGNYTATYSLKSTTNTYWAGNVDDVANKTVNWSIGKAQITKPSIEVSYKIYNGSAQTYSGSGTGYTFTGSGTNFGTYPVTVSLTDTTTTEWNDGTTEDYQVADKLSIEKKSVTLTITKSASSSEYGSSVATITVSASGLVNEGDLGTLSYRAKYSNGGAYAYYTKAEFEGTNPYPAAKSYILEQVYTANDNYYVSADSSPYTITPKAVTLDFYDSDDEEPWHLTFVCTYPDSMYYITVKATGLIGANDLGELGFIATNDETHEVADITVEGAPAGYYTLTPTYTPNANYNVTALQGTARIYVRDVIVPVVVTDTYDYDGTAKAIVFDEVASQGYSQYYTITGNSLTEPGTTTVTVALKAEYAGNVIWGYDERVDEYLDTTDDQTFTLTVNSPLITVTFTYSYGAAVTTIEEDVEVNFFNDAMRALPSFRFFKTAGWRVDGEGSVVTAYTKNMDGKTLNAEFIYAVGTGDANGDGKVTAADILLMKKYGAGIETNEILSEAAAWTIAQDTTDDATYVFVAALDVNGKSGFHTNDIVALREGLATGYDYKIINFKNDLAQISYQKVVKQSRVTVTTYEDLVNYVAAGYPVLLGGDIDAATRDFNLALDVPADIALGNHTLTVNSFTLSNGDTDVTLKIAGGNIYTVEGISVTAPAGNVVVSSVNGYTYEGAQVVLAAYNSSLHIESNVGFYQYKVEGKANAAAYKATVTTDTAINEVSKGDEGIIAITEQKVALMTAKKAAYEQNEAAKAAKQAEVDATDSQDENYETLVAELNDLIDTGNDLSADIDEIPVFKAPVSVPVDTHVVVETSANLEVEQITVVAPLNDTTASTFSVNVKNDEAAVIKVDISEVKEVVEQVNVYHVEEVALEGDTSKVEIVKAEDQTVDTDTTVKTEAQLNAALAIGGKITIGANITSANGYLVTKDCEIDLNGYTITVTSGSNVNSRAIKITHGTLEIYGGSVDAKGAATNLSTKDGSKAGTGCYGALRAELGTTLIAHDLTLYNYRPWGLNVKILGATAELTDVTIYSEYGGGIEVTDDDDDYTVTGDEGYAVLTRCVMNQKYWYDWCSVPVSISGDSTMDVYSTSYNGEYAIYVFSSGGTINVYGGTFTAVKDAIKVDTDTANYYNSASIVNVYGGTFYGTIAHAGDAVDEINIYGGTFDHDPSDYVEDGYVATEDNGIWTVINGTLVMNETELKAALASDTEKIVIGQSFSISTTAAANRINVTRDVVLDLNGYTLTCAEYMFVVQPGATFEITGTGTICYNGANANMGALRVMGSADQATTTVSKLIVGEDVTVQSTGYGIVIWHNNFKSYGSEVVVKGTINAATTTICPSGNIAQQEGDVVNNEPISTIAKITVKSTAVLTATNDSGIYAAGFAVWDIEAGATITGASALYIKSGFVSVPDGVILTATKATVATYRYNGNGGNVTGDGIVIDNCYYPGANAVVTLGDNIADTITVTAESAKKVGTYWAIEDRTQFNEAKNANASYIYIKNDITLPNNTFFSWKAGNGDLTIDLAGHVITGSYTYVLSWSINGTSLNIIDTSASQTGAIVNTSTATAPYVLSIGDTNAVVNIYGGTIRGKIAIKNGNATLNIYGGTIISEATDKYAILNYQGKTGTINLYGGTITASNVGINNDGTGSINLDGATINATKGIENQKAGTINMTSGTINGGNIAIKNYAEGTVNLYGGTLSGKWVVINAGAGTINLDGATITSVACSDDSGIESQKNGVVNVISGSITARTGIATWNKVGNDAAVNVTGGTITSTHICISTNGNDTYATSINVSGGTLVSGECGIYNAGMGNVTVSGTASITGVESGIETRAGVLTVTGGTITSTADTVLVEANGNGTTTTGAGIAVIQHTTKKAITVSVTGGTITGVDAILEANPQNNSDADLALISITIGADATLVGDVVITDEAKISYTNNQNA